VQHGAARHDVDRQCVSRARMRTNEQHFGTAATLPPQASFEALALVPPIQDAAVAVGLADCESRWGSEDTQKLAGVGVLRRRAGRLFAHAVTSAGTAFRALPPLRRVLSPSLRRLASAGRLS